MAVARAAPYGGREQRRRVWHFCAVFLAVCAACVRPAAANNKPSFPSDRVALLFPENAGPDVFVLTVPRATDPDGDPLTYNITHGDVDVFYMTGRDVYTVSNFDFEGPDGIEFDIIVTVWDPAGASDFFRLELTVRDINDAPIITSPSAATSTEMDEPGTVVYTLTFTDQDAANSHTFSVPDLAGLPFGFPDPNQPQLVLLSEIDFETSATLFIEVNITVTDDGSPPLSDTVSVFVQVLDANDQPLFTSPTTATANELDPVGTVVYTATVFDEDPDDSHMFTIIDGIDNSGVPAFAMDAVTGNMTLASVLDFEQGPREYAVRLRVEDDAATAGGDTLRDVITVTVSVIDRNDAPWQASGNFSSDENQAVGTLVGVVEADDNDPADTHTFAIIAGNNNTVAGEPAFTIDADTGELRVASLLNFEAGPQRYFLWINITDDASCCGGSGRLSVTTLTVVNVTDANDRPISVGATEFTTVENSPIDTTVGTVQFFDEDPTHDVTWSIVGGGDGELFLNQSTGTLSLATVLDFESSPLLYTITIRLVDNGVPPLANVVSVQVTLLDTNDPPELVSALEFEFEENLPIGAVVHNASAFDQDVRDTVTFHLVNDTLNNGMPAFAVDNRSGLVTTTTGFDFENDPRSFQLFLELRDDGTAGPAPLSTVWALTAWLTDVNDVPVYTASPTFNLSEHTAVGTPVFTLTAFDQDVLDTVTFDIIGGNNNSGAPAFDVDHGSGVVRLASAMDFETLGTTYDLVVLLTDSGTAGPAPLNTTTVVTASVFDVNDAPVLTSTPAFVVPENADNGSFAAQLTYSDQDVLDRVAFHIVGGNSYFGKPAFAVNVSTGVVTVATHLDFEQLAVTVFRLVVELRDDGTAGPLPLTTTAVVNATIRDANDAPEFTNPAAFELDENLAVGAEVFHLTHRDQDPQDTHSYYIVGGALNGALPALEVDAATGVVRVASPLDFETAVRVYALEVVVWDDATAGAPAMNDTMTVVASLQDVNEPPQLTSVPHFNFTENLPLGTLLYTATWLDVDAGDSVTVAITGGNDNDGWPAFTVQPVTGQLRLASHHNFEVSPRSYALQLRLSDAGPAGPAPLTTDATIDVTLLDVNEPPLFGVNVSDVTYVPENDGAWSTAIYTLPIPDDPDDPAGDLIQYTIVGGNDAGNFQLVHRNVTVVPGADLDFEDHSKNQFVLTIQSNDPFVTGDNFTLAILVTDVNEPPTFTSTPAFSVAENLAPGTVVYTATSHDIDAGDVATYSIAGAEHRHDGSVFAIDPATGDVSVAGVVSFEDTPAVYRLHLLVTDVGGLVAALDATVTVLNRNDPPRLADGELEHVYVSENWKHPPHEHASRQMEDIVHFIKVFDEDGDDVTFHLMGGVNTNVNGKWVFRVVGVNGTAAFIDMNPALDEFTENLDFESANPNPFTLDVMLVDNGSPHPAVTNVTLLVHVVDENDTPTRWSWNTFTAEENSVRTRVLYDFQLEDEDYDGFGDTGTYAVVGGDPNDDFTINPTTGWIFFAHHVDYEAVGQALEWVLEIQVTDQDPPHHTTVFKLPAQLVNMNDPPRVTSAAEVGVLEDHPLGVPLYNFTYFEEDVGDVANFTLVGGNRVADGYGGFGTVFDPVTVLPYLTVAPPDVAPFHVDAHTGQLFLSNAMAPFSPIDYESGPHTFELVVRLTAESADNRLPRFASTDFQLRVHVLEVNEGVIFRPRAETVETADHGLPGLFVYQLPPPYEQDFPHHLNVTYSIAGGNDGTFGIRWQDGVTMVLEVVAPPGTLFLSTRYVLAIRATDAQGAFADLPLAISVLATTVMAPNATTRCFHGEECAVHFLPSLRRAATTFKIDLRQGGQDPLDSQGRPFNGLLAVLDSRDAPGVTDLGRTLLYHGFRPPFVLPAGWYTVRVTSPKEGFDASDGEGEPFYLDFPYVWLAGPWGPCEVDLGCGVGVSRRQVVCHDNRSPEFRPAGAAPDTVFNITEPGPGGSLLVRTVDVFLADPTLCGSRTAQPLPTRRCVEFCTYNSTLPVPVDAKDDAAVISQTSEPCSAPCGGGTRPVTPSCWVRGVGQVALEDCPLPVPSVVACNEAPCGHTVYTRAFTPCDDTCGTGHMFQSVECVDPQGFHAPLAQCGFTTSGAAPLTLASTWPATVSNASDVVRGCAQQPCEEFRYKWRRFGECEGVCGVAEPPVRSRDIHCLHHNEKIVFDDFCDDLLLVRPEATEQCNVFPCERFAFEFGEWSNCDTTCGAGVRTRTVECRSSNGSLVDDLWLCAGGGNGAWINILPPTTMPCEAESGCEAACLADADCPGGEEDGTGNGFCFGVVCRCRKGWSGPQCDIRDPVPLPFCDNGFRDGAGKCCRSVVGPGDLCCSGVDAVLDRNGRCCDQGLDACGVCGGDGVAMDIHQVCCRFPLTASGTCCGDGAVDDCGVCNGDNRCLWVGTVVGVLAPPNFVGTADEVLQATSAANFRFDAALQAFLEAHLLLPAGSVAVGQLQPSGVPPFLEATRRRRRLADHTALLVEVEVEVANMPLSSGTIAGEIQLLAGQPLLAGSDAPTFTVDHVALYHRQSDVCGDGVCEAGEQCTDLKCSNPGGCRLDCPHNVLACPAPSLGAPMCSGHGVCVPTQGTCECFGGYAGPSCSDCAPLHAKLAGRDGPCVLRPAPGCGDGVQNNLEDGVDCGRGCETACAVFPPWTRPPLPVAQGDGPSVVLITLGVLVALLAFASAPFYFRVWPRLKPRVHAWCASAGAALSRRKYKPHGDDDDAAGGADGDTEAGKRSASPFAMHESSADMLARLEKQAMRYERKKQKQKQRRQGAVGSVSPSHVRVVPVAPAYEGPDNEPIIRERIVESNMTPETRAFMESKAMPLAQQLTLLHEPTMPSGRDDLGRPRPAFHKPRIVTHLEDVLPPGAESSAPGTGLPAAVTPPLALAGPQTQEDRDAQVAADAQLPPELRAMLQRGRASVGSAAALTASSDDSPRVTRSGSVYSHMSFSSPLRPRVLGRPASLQSALSALSPLPGAVETAAVGQGDAGDAPAAESGGSQPGVGSDTGGDEEEPSGPPPTPHSNTSARSALDDPGAAPEDAPSSPADRWQRLALAGSASSAGASTARTAEAGGTAASAGSGGGADAATSPADRWQRLALVGSASTARGSTARSGGSASGAAIEGGQPDADGGADGGGDGAPALEPLPGSARSSGGGSRVSAATGGSRSSRQSQHTRRRAGSVVSTASRASTNVTELLLMEKAASRRGSAAPSAASSRTVGSEAASRRRHLVPMSPVTATAMAEQLGPIQRDDGPRHTNPLGPAGDDTASILLRARHVARHGTDPMLVRHGLDERRRVRFTGMQGPKPVPVPHGYPTRPKPPVSVEDNVSSVVAAAVADTSNTLGSKLADEAARDYIGRYGRRPF